MKNSLLRIMEELSSREYFDNYIIEMEINFDSIIGFSKKIFKDNVKEYTEIIKSTTIIESYNIVLSSETGDTVNYENEWQKASMVFYSCEDEHLDTNKYGSFNYTISGVDKYDNVFSNVELKYILDDVNEYEYTQLPHLIDTLIELNGVFIEHQQEKSKLFDKLKKFI